MKRLGALGGVLAGLLATVLLLSLTGASVKPHAAPTRLVAEDASAPLARIAIHYAPSADRVALGVWKQLFAALPAHVVVEVEVAEAAHFDRFVAEMRKAGVGSLAPFHKVVVGASITTWARDRFAALAGDDGQGGDGAILAPPFLGSEFAGRSGDFRSPFAVSRALYAREPRVATYAFEGGDFAATPHWLFVDVNLGARNLGRGDASRARLSKELGRDFGQELVWLGDEVGDVPRHHIMMYMVPLDDHTVAVGDERLGLALLGDAPLDVAPDTEAHVRRFDHAAELLAARGFRVVRFPAVVLSGERSYVTYTNALFDREGEHKIVYLPTYRLGALDAEATRLYRSLGYVVRPIDVAPIYRLNGSLGCLVNVLARG